MGSRSFILPEFSVTGKDLLTLSEYPNHKGHKSHCNCCLYQFSEDYFPYQLKLFHAIVLVSSYGIFLQPVCNFKPINFSINGFLSLSSSQI